MEFRTLNADEIECRVSTVSAKGVALLLYKDARCDMNILDETIGSKNWIRQHTRDNANCIVSIWDAEKSQWISKEDTGTESFTEKEKGLASDSFKRACFNWGIGRELYTAPFIWVQAKDVGITESEYQGKKKYTTRETFSVDSISYIGKKISGLVIINDKTKKIVYMFGDANKVPDKEHKAPETKDNKASTNKEKEAEQSTSKTLEGTSKNDDFIDAIKIATLNGELQRTGVSLKSMCAFFKLDNIDEFKTPHFTEAMDKLKSMPDRKKGA
jgi:hypothetical protein